MKTIRYVLCAFCLALLGISFSNSQLVQLAPKNIHSEAKFYSNANGVLYCDGIQVKFRTQMFQTSGTSRFVDLKDINSSASGPREVLRALSLEFGPMAIVRMVPSANWGDTMSVNRISGKKVHIHDLSQFYMLRFSIPVPLDSTVAELRKIPEVEFADRPVSIVLQDSPNDPDAVYEWALTPLQASQAWDITHGSSNTRIAVVDVGVLQNHPDLASKIVGGDGVSGQHGTWVAGVAAASTNNGFDVASLGWNTSLVTLSDAGNPDSVLFYLAGQIALAASPTFHCDVINMSWGIAHAVTLTEERELCPSCPHPEKWVGALEPWSDNGIYQAIENAIAQGVVCVASAGNGSENSSNYGPNPELCNPWPVPWSEAFPAAYLGVIAVSGTQMVNGNEQFVPGWNYGNFVTVSAPSVGILTTDWGGGEATVSGTSFSSPITCAAISLVKSLNPLISAGSFASTIASILENTADKIDAANHSYTNGRNDYLGYGRVNAYKALKYTIEHYSTTLGGAGTTVVLHENFSTATGTTLTIVPGTTVQMDPGVVLYINGQLIAKGTSTQPITFDRSGSSGSYYGLALQSGSTDTLSYCAFNHATASVSCYSSNVSISNCTFTNATGGVTCASGAAPTINGCTFSNLCFALYIVGCNPLIENNDIENCTNSGIYLSGAAPHIHANTIKNNTQYGIYCYNSSSPWLDQNTISGSGTAGVECQYYSSPYLAVPAFPGNNVIANNGSFGVEALYNSNPVIGSSQSRGYNSLFGNGSYEVHAYSYCTVSAWYNWWGVYPPNSNRFLALESSSIDYSAALSYNPNPGRPKIQVPGDQVSPQLAGPTSDSTLNVAIQDAQTGNYDVAISLFLKVFNANPAGSLLAKQALLFLAEAYERSGKTDFITYLQSKIVPNVTPNSELDVITRHLQAHWLVKGGRYADAISVYKALLEDFPSTTDIEKYALFNIGEIYSSYLGDNVNAVQALTTFQAKYPNDPLASVAAFLMSSTVTPFANTPQKGGGTTASKVPAPGGFDLASNYPNPFNPSTQIDYSLHEAGKVSLVIYDVLGREVATLADAYQQAGRYTVTWNSQSSGIPVSSGVYFARLRVMNDLGRVTFTKTTRLLLMK